MKAISLIEPWASLVAYGLKEIETRSWGSPCTGRIAIHASKSTEAVRDPSYVRSLFERASVEIPTGGPFLAGPWPHGAVIAVARLEACVPMTAELVARASKRELAFGHWEIGRYAWMLKDVRRLPNPIKCRGMLGLWTVPTDVERKIVAA